jgi:UDP-N-acetylmuramoylalanine-D-glutamate ligase
VNFRIVSVAPGIPSTMSIVTAVSSASVRYSGDVVCHLPNSHAAVFVASVLSTSPDRVKSADAVGHPT